MRRLLIVHRFSLPSFLKDISMALSLRDLPLKATSLGHSLHLFPVERSTVPCRTGTRSSLTDPPGISWWTGPRSRRRHGAGIEWAHQSPDFRFASFFPGQHRTTALRFGLHTQVGDHLVALRSVENTYSPLPWRVSSIFQKMSFRSPGANRNFSLFVQTISHFHFFN